MALDNNTVVNYTDKTTIKNWFKTGLKPTQKQFWSTGDSFWHKSESLPISSISGLGNLLDGKAETEHTHTEYATNDADSLTAQNITQWQNKLGINDLDYVVIPTEDATVESHPYVVVIDDEGKSAKRNATDFGKVDTIDGIEADENKNIALGAVRKSESNTVTDDFSMQQENGAFVSIASNGLKVGFGGITATYGTSSISVDNLVPDSAYKFQELLFPKRAVKNEAEKVYPVTYVQGVKADETGRVDISGVAMNWTNVAQRFSGLANKASDATYNLFPVFDSNRNLAYADSPYQMLKNGLSKMTAVQSLEIAQLLNGGVGSAGTMSVNSISPPIIQNKYNTNEYVVLQGANLYLDNTNYAIEILDSTKTNVLATIPQSQIQLYSSGTQLIFFYNFYQFAEGNYFLRLTSGSKIYITTLNLSVVQEVTNIDINNISWEYIKDDAITKPSTNQANGGYVSLRSAGITSTAFNQSYKSSEIFAEGEDFFIELAITPYSSGTWIDVFYKLYFGIGYSSTPNGLQKNALVHYGRSYGNPFFNDSFVDLGNVGISRSVFLKKVGNLFTISSSSNIINLTLSNNSGYSFFAQAQGISSYVEIQVQILRAFKLNQ